MFFSFIFPNFTYFYIIYISFETVEHRNVETSKELDEIILEKIENIEGKMYLFQIYNKDFSEYSKGTPNMHTLYWKALFDERNLKDVVYKLNGQAEMFFREKSIKVSTIHPANRPIQNKNKDNKKKDLSTT